RSWSVDGHLETMTFGGAAGNQTSVYSKKKEQIAKGKTWDGKSVVRVERTLRNPNLMVNDLGKLKNPFQVLVMSPHALTAPLDLEPKKLQAWSMFIDSCAQRGAVAALALVPESRRAEY